MRPIVLRGHTRPVTSLVFSKEGDLLFSGSTDKTISAWYADNGERLGTYNGHNGMVTSVDVNHDTTILASGAADGEARLWDVRSGACTKVLKHSSKVTSVAFSLGSQYLLTANDPWKGTRTSIQVYDISAIMSGAAPEPIAQFILPFDCKVKRAAWGPLNDSIYLACDDGFVRRFSNPIQVFHDVQRGSGDVLLQCACPTKSLSSSTHRRTALTRSKCGPPAPAAWTSLTSRTRAPT
jgi:translation initiation factor 3 subunit I